MADLPDPLDRLDSWKEIAHFLGRTVRTVQRWEKTEGLPVHRGGPAKRGAVVGSKKEIGDWWQRRGADLAATDDVDGEAEAVAARDADVPLDTGHPARRLVGPLVWLAVAVAGIALISYAARPATEPVPAPAGTAASTRFHRVFASSTSEGRSTVEIALSSTPGQLEAAGGDRVFVTLPDEMAIALIDTGERKEIDRFHVLDRPDIMAFDPDRNRLYVGGPAELATIDLAARRMDHMAVGGTVRDLAVMAKGRRVWISLAQAGLKVLDTTSGRLELRPTIGCPMYFAPARNPDRLFLAYQCQGPGGREGHDTVELIDDESRRSVLTRSGPPLVGSFMALSPDEQILWTDVADACKAPQYDHQGCPPGEGAVLLALDAKSLAPVSLVRLPTDHHSATLAFIPDGSRLAASADGVQIVNASLGHVEERLDLPRSGFVAFLADSSRLVVGNPVGRSLLVFALDEAPDARSLSGLASYWPGEETANDLAGGTHASASGVAFAPGRLGRAFAFDARTAEINFGIRSEIDVRIEVATTAAWIKPAAIASPMTIAGRSGAVGWRWWITADGRPAYCFVDSAGPISCARGGVVDTRKIPAGEWRHLAVVRSGSLVTLYIDAVPGPAVSLDGYTRPDASLYDEGAVLRIGNSGDGTARFSGLIDELTMFKRALTPSDIARLARVTSQGGR